MLPPLGVCLKKTETSLHKININTPFDMSNYMNQLIFHIIVYDGLFYVSTGLGHSAHIFSQTLSWMRMFVAKIYIYTGRCDKADCPPNMGGPYPVS